MQKLIFFQLFSHLLVIGFVKIASYQDLEGIAVVDIDKEKTDGDGAEQSTDV